MWACAAHYKEIPSGAGEPLVWDRCNYSDNIRGSITLRCSPPSQGGEWEACVGECSYLALSFTSSAFLFFVCTLLFTPVFLLPSPTWFLPSHELIHTLASPARNTCSYIPSYLVMFVKGNLFQWDGNQMKGNHTVTVQLLIVPPYALY